MSDFFPLLIGTIILRPYVFIFFITFIILAVTKIGGIRTSLFTFAAYFIAFLSEYSSTHNGFPYGFYTYIETTRNQELWVLNVPFMDSISYCFLSYFSYTLALFLVSDLIKINGEYISKEAHTVRQSFMVLITGTCLLVTLDIVIDPTALRGSKWFLGQIYNYHDKGIYFGVPISNFIGWFIVGFAILFLYQNIDKYLYRKGIKDIGIKDYPYKIFLGPIVYFSVMLFIITVTIYIKEYRLAATSTMIFSVILLIFLNKIIKPFK